MIPVVLAWFSLLFCRVPPISVGREWNTESPGTGSYLLGQCVRGCGCRCGGVCWSPSTGVRQLSFSPSLTQSFPITFYWKGQRIGGSLSLAGLGALVGNGLVLLSSSFGLSRWGLHEEQLSFLSWSRQLGLVSFSNRLDCSEVRDCQERSIGAAILEPVLASTPEMELLALQASCPQR